MSIRRWLVLWLLFMGYLFLGATIFFRIERDLEEKRRYERYYEQREIQFFLQENCVSLTDVNKREKMSNVIAKVSNYCGKPFSRVISNSTHDEPYVWTYYNSFFFALTTLSTIGYGNLSPTSEEGKLCVILYALVGIPFNGIVLTHLGDFFGSKFLRAHHRYKNQFYETRVTLILDILVYLIPGIGVFILVPSVVFQHFEEWTFVESIYFSFVSLTTIGYGDYVAGQETNGTFSHVCYKIFLIFWIMFGLGYLVMILGFISRAMRSKQINKLERKVTHTLKQTQSRIWQEFVQDIQYLRRALNELYLLKVKPVYKESLYNGLHLSHSCPNLTEWPTLRPKGFEFEAKLNIPMRRRAFSENIPEEKLFRVLSDGALKDIDRQATFPMGLEPTYLINSVADAFGPGSPQESDSEDYKEDGMHGFSDEEILATEDYTSSKESNNTTWMLGGAPFRRRGRAMSDSHFIDTMLGPQKTWSGVDSLHQFALLKAMRAKGNEPLINEEHSEEKVRDSSPTPSPAKSLRRFSTAAINFFTPANRIKKKSLDEIKERENENGQEKKRRSQHNSKNSGKIHRLSLQEEEDHDIYDELNYFSQTTGRRPSILDILTSTQNNTISPVLEQTSIADFIRVVNSLKAIEKSRSNTPPLNSIFAKPYFAGKKRTLSTSGGSGTPERRCSQVPNVGLTAESGIFRRRAASITPVMSPRIERRLKRFSTSSRLMVPSGRSSGRVTPTLPPAPSVVVTSPDGSHKFSVQNVAETKRRDSLWEVITRP